MFGAGKSKNTARGVISSSRLGAYLGVLSEHKEPSPVFQHCRTFDLANKKTIAQKRTQGTVPCVPLIAEFPYNANAYPGHSAGLADRHRTQGTVPCVQSPVFMFLFLFEHKEPSPCVHKEPSPVFIFSH